MTAADPRDENYSAPDYYFIVKVGGMTRRADFLRVTDTLEIELLNEEGEAIGNVGYTLHLSTGEKRRSSLNKDGHAVEEDLPPREVVLELEGAAGTIGDSDALSGHRGRSQ